MPTNSPIASLLSVDQLDPALLEGSDLPPSSRASSGDMLTPEIYQTKSEQNAAAGPLDQLLSQGAAPGQARTAPPDYSNIQAKRKVLDDALKAIIQQRSQPYMGTTNSEIARAGYNPFAPLGERSKYFQSLAQAHRDDSLFNEARQLEPLQLEAQRAQLQEQFAEGDRDAWIKEQAYNMDNLLKMLQIQASAAPSYRSAKITNPDGTTQTAMVNSKDPTDVHPIGDPAKPSASATIMKHYDELSSEAASYEGAQKARDKLLELSKTFPKVGLGRQFRADLDQATEGKIPGLFPGKAGTADNYNEYMSYATDLVLALGEKMKGSLSDKDRAFLEDGATAAKMAPDKRAQRLQSIIDKLDAQYKNTKSRMSFYESKYNLSDVVDNISQEGVALPGTPGEMDDDQLLQEYQDLLNARGQL